MKFTDYLGSLTYSNNVLVAVAPDEKEKGSFKHSGHRSCREEFAGYMNDATTHIGYAYNGINFKLVEAFWKEVEKRIGLKDSKSVVHETTMKNVVVIELDPFWVKNTTRRSFCTLLLRAAALFYKGDFDAALKAYPLSASILPAVNHFLSGKTTPTYEGSEISGSTGVVARFYGKQTESELNRQLVHIITE